MDTLNTKDRETPVDPAGNGLDADGGNENAVLDSKVSSISEAAEVAAAGRMKAPWFLRWIEYPFRVTDPYSGGRLPEVTGWAMDSAARGPLNQVGSYVGAAILRLASQEAKCTTLVTCQGRVYGLRPSSLLTATSAVVGVFAALTMPIVGAVVDHTQYRKQVGMLSGFMAVFLTGIEISLSEDNWFFILCVDAVQGYAVLVHMTAVFAYLPDLSTLEETISHYSSRFNVRQYVAQFIYVSTLVITSTIRGNDRSVTSTVRTAKESAGIAFGLTFVFIAYSWLFLFRDRPALSRVPEGSNLITAGFQQVSSTSKKIVMEYNTLKWFMFSLLWSPEAGSGVVVAMAVTFLTVVMRFSAFEIAVTNLIFLAGTVCGSFVAKVANRIFNPLNAYRGGLLFLATALAVSIGVLDGPDRKASVYGFAVTWGIGTGWAYPSQRVLFCTLIPKGQETEMMGLFVFVGQILGWLPPLVFTIMNERGINMRWSLAVVPFFCVFAVICTLPMGNYHSATQLVAKDSASKFDQVIAATSKRISHTESREVCSEKNSGAVTSSEEKINDEFEA